LPDFPYENAAGKSRGAIAPVHPYVRSPHLPPLRYIP
jgi:hypothetical protein